jgi:hypothetical protein
MKSLVLPRRALATGAVSALALGGTVLAAPAQAAPATTTYTCSSTIAGVGPYDVTVTTDVPGVPATPLAAGADIPANFLNVTNHVTIPAQMYGLFGFLQVTKVELADFAVSLGTASIGTSTPLTASSSSFTPSGATFVADINGKNAAFELPAAGTNTVLAPASFKVNGYKADGSPSGTLTCAVKTGTTAGTIGSVTTVKNAATLTAKAKKVAAGKPAKVKVKVAAPNQTPTGKVVAKIGAKKVGKGVLNAKGKATVKVKAKFLTKAKNKVTLFYKGDGFTEAAKGKVFVKVAR